MPLAYALFFFFNDTATTEIYTLSLHDALPIYAVQHGWIAPIVRASGAVAVGVALAIWGDHLVRRGMLRYGAAIIGGGDRKSTRLNSSHSQISYAVFCLKKKQCNQHAGVCHSEF